MKLATTTKDFSNQYTLSQITALEHIYDAGFRYAGYGFGPDYRRRNGIYGEEPLRYIQKVKRAADDIGIQLIQAHSPMGKPFFDHDGQFTADTVRCIEACAEWGIPDLVVHSGYAPNLTIRENYEINKRFFTNLLTHAEKYGVNILVENFNKMHKENVYWIDNAPDLLGLIEYVDHPLFHAVWDTGHANMQDMPQDEALRMLGSHVRGLHVQDNLEVKDIHLTPFFGSLSLDAVMNGLLDIGYRGYFTFEVGGIFLPADQRRPFPRDTRLASAPMALRDAFERFLYDLGKTVLEAYGCFEE